MLLLFSTVFSAVMSQAASLHARLRRTAGARVPAEPPMPLPCLGCRGSVEAAKELLDQGADVNCENARGSTPVRSRRGVGERSWGGGAGGPSDWLQYHCQHASLHPLLPALQLHFAAAAKSRTHEICELLLDAGADTQFTDLQARRGEHTRATRAWCSLLSARAARALVPQSTLHTNAVSQL